MDCGGGEVVSRTGRGRDSGGDDGMEEEKGKVPHGTLYPEKRKQHESGGHTVYMPCVSPRIPLIEILMITNQGY